jgi:hypothetical protein
MEEEINYNEVILMVNNLIQFYNKLDTIQDYFYEKKKEKVKKLDLTRYNGLLFNDPTMSPMDMDITFEVLDSNFFNTIVQSIASMPVESQIGRQLNIGVKENNTGTYLGFTRIASPVISIKPRSEYFDYTPNSTQVNKHMVNGCQIIPVQPFGYNYLGGKLIALVSTSHEVRNIFNEKYNQKCEILHWETTSLYGDIKGTSMYDGMKPFIRYQGLTESENLLLPTDEVYTPILKRLREFYGKTEWEGRLVNPKGSGPKMREFNKMISIIKNKLKENDIELYNQFNQFIKEKMKAKTKKRFYYSNYGYDNGMDKIKYGDNVELVKGENYDKFNLDYMINWWKNKATKRWDKLKIENSLKTELEIYTKETIHKKEIQMIR